MTVEPAAIPVDVIVPVDIIVPVYAGLEETRRCLEGVLAHAQATPHALILIDDATPEPALAAYLDRLAAERPVVLLRNLANEGFVRAVNRGMALHPERDVVLLNSDTEVANDWLDRLRRCAVSAPDIGTVTPFSNNATICSFPDFCADNPLPDGLTLAELDACFRRANAGACVEIPTAVGFCMYIKRACLDAVGPFDAERFPRGYGEENDFSRRAAELGWRNVLCADTFVYHRGGVSFQDERAELMRAGAAALLARHPDYDALVQAHIRADPAAGLRRAVLASIEQASPEPASDTRPVQLHVLHDLGGGIARWCEDYCAADTTRANLVLKAYTHGPAFGQGLALYTDPRSETPVWLRIFAEPIGATVTEHAEYRAAIREILQEYRVDGILVSSLIGHALDILDTGLPTLVVQHDFYPICPAINAYFDGICGHCDGPRIAECARANPDFNPFQDYPGAARAAVRERFLALAGRGAFSLAAPTDSVRERLARLAPALADIPCATIPHGYPDRYARLPEASAPGERLRIVVLGMLAVSKGMRLLQECLDELRWFADIHLIGAREVGELFRDTPGVHVVDRYRPEELQGLIAGIAPDLGLLMSICHETFSYTLSELFAFGIPPVATRVGSFAERIRHGENGFLYEPDAAALLACLRGLHADRAALAGVRARLGAIRHRSAEAMVADYHRLLPLRGPLRADAAPAPRPVPDAGTALVLGQAGELSRSWKEIKSLRLTSYLKDVRRENLTRRFDDTAREAAARLSDTEARLRELEARLSEATTATNRLENQLAEILTSTSWSISRPVRGLGNGLRKLRILGRCLTPLRAAPGRIPGALAACVRAYRAGGAPGLKLALLSLPESVAQTANSPRDSFQQAASAGQDEIGTLDSDDWRQRAWWHYKASFDAAALAARIDSLPARPLISVLIPVHDTPEAMLRAMLDSLLAQIYPHWEACLADDGSRAGHVRAILKDYARRDRRIRIHFGWRNRGVSHASNRALRMARGEFAVLLDHDDLLEPQALLRVAEAVVEDAPDMVYSDEIIVGADGETPEHFIFRPAFSPEYLRAHPYIVHLVGFRTEWLRRLGGFDKTLRISQDYDLILRASERARRIVHIPEILYRWRTHPGSAGHARMSEVMAASKAALRRHLKRRGETGEVRDGASFNFFELRYPLPPGHRVAIVIPTRNHADLVRVCIDSLRRSIESVAYDIVLVDHASDDPKALAYFASLDGHVRVLRYDGPFNFSAINNWAVACLPDNTYTHYLFCNNDIEAIGPGWLERMLELFSQPDIGIVGAKLYYPDRKTLQHAGVVVACCGVAENLARFRDTSTAPLDLGYIGSLVATRELSAVTAACMLIRKSVFDEIGGFDVGIAVGYGDVDLCLRVRDAGYRIVFRPQAELLHHESYTRGRHPEDPHPDDTARFTAKWWRYYAEGDPYFNPNLSAHSPNWQIAEPLVFHVGIRRRGWRPSGKGA